MASSGEVLVLYRAILKAAARFPSRKRAAIIEDIKAEFRDGSRATELAEVKQRLALAQDGLARLRSFSGAFSGVHAPCLQYCCAKHRPLSAEAACRVHRAGAVVPRLASLACGAGSRK